MASPTFCHIKLFITAQTFHLDLHFHCLSVSSLPGCVSWHKMVKQKNICNRESLFSNSPTKIWYGILVILTPDHSTAHPLLNLLCLLSTVWLEKKEKKGKKKATFIFESYHLNTWHSPPTTHLTIFMFIRFEWLTGH